MNEDSAQYQERGWPYGTSGLERSLGNGKTRVLIAVIAIPILLLVFLEGGWWLSGLIFLFSIGASFELSSMTREEAVRPYALALFLAVTSLHLLLSFAHNSTALGERVLPLGLILLVLFVVITLVNALRYENRRGVYRSAGTFLAFLYGGALFSAVPMVYHHIPEYVARAGVYEGTSVDSFHFIAVMFVSIWLCDTGAYVVGRAVGKRKLAPTISPNKSREGAVGGLLFAVAGAVVVGLYLLDGFDLLDSVVIGLIAGVLGQTGDLVESHIKRAFGVKDSSAIIPGHGGILDRFDSLLLVAPALLAYLYLRPIIEGLFL